MFLFVTALLEDDWIVRMSRSNRAEENGSTEREHPGGRLLRLPSGFVAEVLAIDEEDSNRYFRIVVLRTGERKRVSAGCGRWIDGGVSK